MLFISYLAQKPIDNDYRTVEIYRCPSYPDKNQTICFVVNGWDFKSRNDWTGTEIMALTRLTKCTRRAETPPVDNENGPAGDHPSATDPDVYRCDVWNPGHLPTSDSQDVTNGRRIARERHKNGCNGLYLDWHVEWLAAEDITADQYRFQK
jgi:prepilin-type processing-associated H-X9-DG protein